MDVIFDQHYLKDETVLDLSIESSNIDKNDIILEIGPGKGILTKKILDKNPKKLISVEIDKNHKVILDTIESNTLEIIYDNALEVFDKLEFNKIIANIPYTITEKLYSKIIDKKVPFIILMHGIDFYKNITQRDTRWKYFVPAFYDLTLLDTVLGDSFEPPTKVQSTLIKLELKKKYSKFELFIQMIFLKRHRSLKNTLIYSLVDSLSISKKEAKSMIQDFELSPLLLEQKVTQIKNQDFVEIIEKIKNIF